MTRLSVDYAGLVRGLRVPLAPADLGAALLDAVAKRVPVIMQVRSGAPITLLSGAGCGGRARCRPSVSITV